ncbi:hypothetical protein SUDANB176_07824 (plasmid) [Streptomyces sp. enrichment culture]|uniref:RNA polymerase sigma factor n=1 Tax=Streptomyces sp. enrichment culture TaxID=1795815 RepID=UPI003F549C47
MAEQEAAEHARAVSVLAAERYEQMVGYARRRLCNFRVPPSSADPEDVVQAALERVLSRTEPIEDLRPYVFKVIKNEVWHAAQRYRNGQGYRSLDADVQLEVAGPATADPCGTADLRLDVKAALDTLPLQQRKAVWCTKAWGLTQAETAQTMGAAAGTIATHVSRAVITLRVILETLVVVLVVSAMAWAWTGTAPVDPAAGGELVTQAGHLAAQIRWPLLFMGIAASGVLARIVWRSYIAGRPLGGDPTSRYAAPFAVSHHTVRPNPFTASHEGSPPTVKPKP